MSSSEQSPLWRAFEAAAPHYRRVAAAVVDDPEAVMAEAGERFAGMMPDMAYRDDPGHPMASAVFFCSAALAVYLASRSRGVDAHAYGRAMLSVMRGNPPPKMEPDPARVEARRAGFVDAAAVSQERAKPGEFVFEALSGDGEDFDWGMNIRSCAICHAFSRYDAMDLVPYMCATDDVTSDWGNSGLERTGTIAVGAHQCDFRFKQGRQGRHLDELYPERIRLAPDD